MSTSVLQPLHLAKTFTAGLTISLALLFAAGVGSVYAADVSFSSTRNYNVNSILNGGAMSVTELQQDYNADTKAQTVYSWYGISRADINDMKNTAVAGTAHKNGEVRVNGKVVATNATSAGYNSGAGRNKVTHNGVTFYDSASQNVFVGEKIDAYVVLNEHGQFKYAVLASCGNPMKANNVVPAPKPVEKPVEKPTPTPVTPTPVTPTPPEVTPTVIVQPVAAVAPAPVELPKAGPAGSVAALFGSVSVLAGAAHALVMRRKRNLSI